MQMFAKPEVGKTVRCITDWSAVMRGHAEYVPRRREHVGEVVPSERWDDPRTFRMINDAYNRKYHPVCVVPLEKVALLEYVDGAEAQMHEYTPPEEQTWSVKGSGKSWYTVAVKGDRWSCSCPGYIFRKTCRHINAKKTELDAEAG